MKKFRVLIRAKIEDAIEVEAKDRLEAEEIAESKWYTGQFDIDPENVVDISFFALKSEG